MLQSVQFQTFLIAIFMLYRSNAQLAPETDEYENQDENEGLEFRLLQNRVHKTVPSILPIINGTRTHKHLTRNVIHGIYDSQNFISEPLDRNPMLQSERNILLQFKFGRKYKMHMRESNAITTSRGSRLQNLAV